MLYEKECINNLKRILNNLIENQRETNREINYILTDSEINLEDNIIFDNKEQYYRFNRNLHLNKIESSKLEKTLSNINESYKILITLIKNRIKEENKWQI